MFSNPLDLLDHSLLLDIFFLGTPQLRTGFRFLFFFKVSFMKHPSVHLLCSIYLYLYSSKNGLYGISCTLYMGLSISGLKIDSDIKKIFIVR